MDCLKTIPRLWPRKKQQENSVEHTPSSSDFLGTPRPPTPNFWLPTNTADYDDSLCTLCRYLNFRTILQHGISNNFIPLGFFTSLREKSISCTFCRLAAAAIIRGWESFVGPDWDSLPGVELAKCELACNNVSLCPLGQAKHLSIRVYPLPPQIAEAKVRSGRVDINAIHLITDDVHVFGLRPEYHCRKVSKNIVELLRMKEWLEICEEFHAEECAKEIDENTANIPSCLRVIDVEENRLVTVTPGLRYIALSYVWGQVSSVFQYRTTKSNFQRRTEKGGLDGVVFPRTIRDAIVLVGLLGQRYLWVDAVCIIQDDDTDQAVQISSMNIIYGASHLTVVAASGSDAEAGLSRAHADSPSADLVQHMETVQGVRMMLPLKKLPEALSSTMWFTRGWTYQERLLPCRRLYFTPEQVYFECRRCTWSEDVLAEERTFERSIAQVSASGGNQLKKRPIAFGWDNATLFLPAYSRKVEEYTWRNVSYDTDALNAFMGVAAVLAESYGAKNTLFYGLPGAQLEATLLWQPKKELIRRKSGERGVFLPSWSWAGWRGPVTYTNRSPWMSISGSWMIAASVVPEWILHTSPTNSHVLKVQKESMSHRYTGSKPVSNPPPPPPQLPNTRPLLIPPGTLEFLTTSAYFSILPGSIHGDPCYCYDNKPPHEHADKIHCIIDARGNTAGNVFLDDDIPTTPQEFIIVARSGSGVTTCPGYDEKVYEKAAYCLFDAMMVKWKDGMAERRGLGKIHEDAWVGAELTWKRVFLR